MATLRVSKVADTIIVPALGGRVDGIKVIVARPNVDAINQPTALTPAAGNVVVARRNRPAGAEVKYGTVTVGWDDGDDRTTKVLTW